MNQDGTLVKTIPVIPLSINDFLHKYRNICGDNITSPWQSIGWLGHSNLGKQEEIN